MNLRQTLLAILVIVLFVMAAGAPGSAGHTQPPKGQIGQGQPGPPPGQLKESVNWFALFDQTTARSVNWNRTGK